MKPACLLTDFTYILAISDSGGKDKDVFGLGFIGMGEGATGDEITRAGSAGKGSVSKIVVGTEVGVSGTVVGTKAGVGTSSNWVLPAFFVLASDPGSCHSLDFVDSWLVLKVVAGLSSCLSIRFVHPFA